MTATLPASVAEIKGLIDELSRKDRLLLNEVLRLEGESGQWDAIAWPWELLESRKAALERGESRALPLEEVASRLRLRRVSRS